MNAICGLFLSSSHIRLSSVIVVFIFNASLNDVTPLSPVLLAVDFMRMEKSGLLIDTLCAVSFVLTTQIKRCECCV